MSATEINNTQHDRALTVAEVATRLRKSRKWVYQNKTQMPFARPLGRSWFFSERGLESWLQNGQTEQQV